MTPEHLEAATTTSIDARRYHIVAQWALKQLGLSGEQLQCYAVQVHKACYQEQGPNGVVSEIFMGSNRSSSPVGQDAVRQVLTQSEASARGGLLETD